MRTLLAAVAAATAGLSHPQTLATVYNAPIAAFAQDGGTLAWFVGRRGTKCNAVHLYSLRYGVGYDLPSQSKPNVTCRFVWSRNDAVELALAGGRALWALPQDSPLALDYLLGAGVTPRQSDRAERRLLEAAHTTRGVGQWLGGIAGDHGTLAYAITSVDWADESGCLAGSGPCTLVESGGGVFLVRGRQAVRVRGSRPAVEVAAAAGRIAYVPTGRIEKNGRPRPTARDPIAIVEAASGHTITRVVPQGVPLAIALAPDVLATLERTPLGLRLAWYDATSGRIRGSVPVPRTTTPSLTASDESIVFRVGNSIRGVSVTSHRVRVLARAAATPVGLSLEGGRLAWAENLKSTGRIRAVYVSGRG